MPNVCAMSLTVKSVCESPQQRSIAKPRASAEMNSGSFAPSTSGETGVAEAAKLRRKRGGAVGAGAAFFIPLPAQEEDAYSLRLRVKGSLTLISYSSKISSRNEQLIR